MSRPLNLILLLSLSALIVSCSTPSKLLPYRPEVPSREPTPEMQIQGLKAALGMERSPEDLGFAERAFNPCQQHFDGAAESSSTQACARQYLTVVHFQLFCRDSEGTVSAVPLKMVPIVAEDMTWQLVGRRGATQTDAQGFGQFALVSARSARNQRLILHMGPKFVGFNVSEITKIVLPKNYCRADHE